jgi:hypothetical protein
MLFVLPHGLALFNHGAQAFLHVFQVVSEIPSEAREPYSHKPLMAYPEFVVGIGFPHRKERGFGISMLFVLPHGLALFNHGTQAFLHVFQVH